jgi:hypothetical protein
VYLQLTQGSATTNAMEGALPRVIAAELSTERSGE